MRRITVQSLISKALSLLLVLQLAIAATGLSAPSIAWAGSDSWSKLGLDGKKVISMAVSPNFKNDHTIMAGTIDNGVWKSGDGGATWETAGSTLKNKSIYSITFSINYATDNIIFAGTGSDNGDASIYKSGDAGDTWTKVLNTSNVNYVHSMAIAAGSDTDTVMFTGTYSAGILRSTDGGLGWGQVSGDLPASAAGRAIVASPNFASDHTVFAGIGDDYGDGGVYTSTDAGSSWIKTSTSGSSNDALRYTSTVAVSPNFASDRTMFAGTNTGVYKSTDGGQTWERANSGFAASTYANQIAVSPNYSQDQTLFAATNSGVYISTNRGAGWKLLNTGLTSNYAMSLALSPDYSSDKSVFVGTLGGGVFVYGNETPPDTNGGEDPGPGNGGGGGGGGGDSTQQSSIPSNLQATVSASGITLVWNYATDAYSYNIYRKTASGSFAKIGTSVGHVYADAAITPGTTYTYHVKAVSESGSESDPSNEATITAVAVIQPPTNLSSVSSDKNISLSWSASSNANGYRIYRKEGSGVFTKLNASLTSGTSYVDTTAKSGFVYRYYVTAIGANNAESIPSNTITAGLNTVQGTVTFSDVPTNAWYKDNVARLVSLKITSGYPNGTFGPNKTISRAEFAKMICLAMGWQVSSQAKASFSDVPKNHWAYGYVETARARGVIAGYAGGVFLPNKNITRAEIAKIIAATLKLPGGYSTLKDINGHWARASINACVTAGVIGGFPGDEFRPNVAAKRAEAAKMITGVLDHK